MAPGHMRHVSVRRNGQKWKLSTFLYNNASIIDAFDRAWLIYYTTCEGLMAVESTMLEKSQDFVFRVLKLKSSFSPTNTYRM